jgi:hypothetical protein
MEYETKNNPFGENRFFLWLGQNTIYIVGFNYLCRDIATELYYFIPVLRKHTMHWSMNFILTLAVCIGCTYFCSTVKSLFARKIQKKDLPSQV